MVRTSVLVVGLWWVSTAAAAPIVQSGRLTDTSGVPLNGTYTIGFSIYADGSTSQTLWAESDELTLQDGYYTTLLGDTQLFDDTLWNGAVRWLGVSVDDVPLLPRSPIHAVPHALSATAITGPLHAPSADIDGPLRARQGVQLDTAEGLCPSEVAEGTVEYRAGELRACSATGWTVLATATSVQAVSSATSAIAADYLDSSDYAALQSQAGNWPAGSYCIVRGLGSCPSGFSEYSNYIKAIQSYSGIPSYFRSRPFGDSGIFPHSSHPYYSELRLQMCCK